MKITMKPKNKLRLFIGMFFYKKAILFSRKSSREQQIIKKINNCFPCFANFKKVKLYHFYLIFPLMDSESNYFNQHY